MKITTFFLLSIIGIICACSQQSKQIKYLGQTPPADHPEVFGEGIVSVDSSGEALISVTVDGLALYFPRYYKDKEGRTNGVKSLYTRYDGIKWTELKIKDKTIFYRTPHFVSDTLAIMASNGCIWKSIKLNDSTWSKPVFMDSLDLSRRNGVSDWSITGSLILFFVQNGDIKTAQIKDNKIESTKEIIGFKGFKTRHVGIAPEGDYLLCDGFIEGINNGWTDTYISFKTSSDQWTFPIHLDSTINVKDKGNYLPRVSPDGEVFFFSRQDSINHGDIYWMQTKGLKKYRPKDL